MPKIPTYNSQINLTTEVPAIRVSPENYGMEGRAVQQVGGLMAEIGEKMEKVQIEQESDAAMLEASKRINQIEFDASNDTQVNGMEDKYGLRIKQTRDELSNGIKNPLAKAAFQAKYDQQAVNTQFKVKQYGYKNLIEQRVITLGARTRDLEGQYFNEVDPALKQQKIDQIAALYESAAHDGTMTKIDAQKNINDVMSRLPAGQAEWDIKNNPQMALNELTRGDYGMYSGINPEKRIDLIDKARSAIEKAEKQSKYDIAIAQNKNEDNLIRMKIDGKLTEDDVVAQLNAGQIRPKFAEAQIRNLRSANTISAKTNDAVFNSLVNDLFDTKLTDEEIRTKMLVENTKGKLDSDDLNLLYTFSQEVTTEKLGQGVSKIYPKSFWQNISIWSDEYVGDEFSDQRNYLRMVMFKDYVTRVKNGAEPEQAIKEVIKKQVVNASPDILSFGENGALKMDKNGVIKRILPTGEMRDN